MKYLIDGYNYLFRLLHKNEEVRAIRDGLIAYLKVASEEDGLEISLVFDSKYQKGEHTQKKEDLFELIFTDEGESADEWIIHELKTTPNAKQITVVTSDLRLAMHCRNYLALTMECKAFKEFLIKKEKTRHLKQARPLLKNLAVAPPKNVKSGFDYYLEEFEKRVEPLPPPKPKKKHKETPKPKKEEKLTAELEMERWERLFKERDATQRHEDD